jgi:multiple sugar transport system permease protein
MAHRTTRGALARREAWEGRLFVAPWFLGFLIFTAGPMLASLYFAFTDYSVLSTPIGSGSIIS